MADRVTAQLGRHAAPEPDFDDAIDDGPSRLRRFAEATAARAHVLIASILAGVLLCLAFPPVGWWYTAIAAFALLGWVLIRPATTPRGGFGYGFLFGFAFAVPLLPWTGNFVGTVPWLGLSALCALFPAVFGLAAVAVRALPGWPLWFAGLWIGAEWLKCTVPFGGFPWGVVAYSQSDGPLLALVRIGGAPLLSFAVVLTGFSLTAIATEVVGRLRSGGSGDAPPRVVLPGVCVVVVLLVTSLTWPQLRQSASIATTDPAVTVAAVQGNVPRLGLDFNAQRRAVLDNHVRETLRLAEEVRAGRAPQPQFVVWPENSSDIDPIENEDAARQITLAADAVRAPILVGAVLVRPDWRPDNPAASNVVVVWDPERGPGERHVKQIVQPFGEYLPWRGFFSKLSSYADRAGYFVPGNGSGVVHAAGVPVGVTTCWEVIFDRAARESVLNGAQVLAVPTNNATFDQSMSEQLLAFAKVRAVEHDRYTVVSGTVGISAVIAPDGREQARTGFFEPAYLDRQVHLKTSLTPATRWGPIVQWLLIAVGVGARARAVFHMGGSWRAVRGARRTASTTTADEREPADVSPRADTGPRHGEKNEEQHGDRW